MTAHGNGPAREGRVLTTIDNIAMNVADLDRSERFKVTIAFVRDPDGHLVELGQQHA